MVEREQLARIVVGIIVLIVINGVRGPEARRHVTMRRTEAGANVEDGSNNQKMVFQFDLYYSTRQTATCFPVIVCIDLPSHRVPTASSVMQLVCYERQCPNIPCGALVQTIIMHQLPHGPRMLPLFLHLLARKQKSLRPMSRAVSRPLGHHW